MGWTLTICLSLLSLPAWAVPVIQTQPKAASAIAGKTFSFEVVASSNLPLSYRWFKNGVLIAGADRVSLSFSAAVAADAGDYAVEVSDATGAVMSQPARLTIPDSAPVFLSQPRSYTGFVDVAFSMVASVGGSAPITYQWYRNDVAIPDGANRVFGKIATAADSGTYKVIATNAFGQTASAPFTLLFRAVPPQIQGPLGITMLGTSHEVRVVAEGSGPLTYRWIRNGVEVTGAYRDSYPEPNSVGQTYTYEVIVTNPYGSTRSAALTYTHIPTVTPPAQPVVITRQPLAQTVRLGQPLELSVEAQGPRVFTYEWRRNNNVIRGATSARYVVPVTDLIHAGSYRAIVRENSTNSAASDLVTVTVDSPSPVPLRFQTQPRSLSVTAGRTFILAGEVHGTGTISYQWYKDGVAIAGANQASLVVNGIPSAAGTYRLIASGSGQTLTSRNAVITITTGVPVVADLRPPKVSLNFGADVNLPITSRFVPWRRATYAVELAVESPSGGTFPFSYQWFVDDVAISGQTFETFRTTFTAERSTTVKYSVRVTNSVGSTTKSINVKFDLERPIIDLHPLPRLAKVGSTLTLSANAVSDRVMTYQWYKDGVAIAGADQRSYVIDSVTPSAAGRYVFRATTSAGNATSNEAVVQVVPADAGHPPPVFVVQPVSLTVKAGEVVVLKAAVAGAGKVSYRWYKDNEPPTIYSLSGDYRIENARAFNSGTYRVEASSEYLNSYLKVTSAPVTLTVIESATTSVVAPPPAGPGTKNPVDIQINGGF